MKSICKYSLAGLGKHRTRGRNSRLSRQSKGNWAISLSEARNISTISPSGARTKALKFTT
eukprot:10022830-Heterocapsa_arctica.AAC.1